MARLTEEYGRGVFLPRPLRFLPQYLYEDSLLKVRSVEVMAGVVFDLSGEARGRAHRYSGLTARGGWK